MSVAFDSAREMAAEKIKSLTQMNDGAMRLRLQILDAMIQLRSKPYSRRGPFAQTDEELDAAITLFRDPS